METLITNFSDHPDWCSNLKSTNTHNGLVLGQLVYDMNNTLCQIIHISVLGHIRLQLFTKGIPVASVSSLSDMVKVLNY